MEGSEPSTGKDPFGEGWLTDLDAGLPGSSLIPLSDPSISPSEAHNRQLSASQITLNPRVMDGLEPGIGPPSGGR